MSCAFTAECSLCRCGLGVGADVSYKAFRELLAKLGWENVRDADGREHWCCARCCTQSIARASGAV